MKDFKKLKIWQQGIQIVKHCYDLTNLLPSSERFNLVSQINRAAVSIPSNIAEGSSRKSEKEQSRFLEIALGSCFELETQLIILEELRIIPSAKIKDLTSLLEEEQKMISGLAKKLNT